MNLPRLSTQRRLDVEPRAKSEVGLYYAEAGFEIFRELAGKTGSKKRVKVVIVCKRTLDTKRIKYFDAGQELQAIDWARSQQ